jgi:hypothetical protein
MEDLIEYAASDVRYLVPLAARLREVFAAEATVHLSTLHARVMGGPPPELTPDTATGFAAMLCDGGDHAVFELSVDADGVPTYMLASGACGNDSRGSSDGSGDEGGSDSGGDGGTGNSGGGGGGGGGGNGSTLVASAAPAGADIELEEEDEGVSSLLALMPERWAQSRWKKQGLPQCRDMSWSRMACKLRCVQLVSDQQRRRLHAACNSARPCNIGCFLRIARPKEPSRRTPLTGSSRTSSLTPCGGAGRPSSGSCCFTATSALRGCG